MLQQALQKCPFAPLHGQTHHLFYQVIGRTWQREIQYQEGKETLNPLPL